MRFFKVFLALICVLCLSVQAAPGASAESARSAQAEADAQGAAAGHSAGEHHALPQYAVKIGEVLGLPITNSMVVTWIAAAVIIIFAQVATRKMKDVPGGAQNFWEWMVESLYEFLRASSVRAWSRGRFGFSRASSYSYCSPTGSACCQEWAPSVGAPGPSTALLLASLGSAVQMPT
jgi:hypothetical protein